MALTEDMNPPRALHGGHNYFVFTSAVYGALLTMVVTFTGLNKDKW